MVNILTISLLINNLTYCQHSEYMSSHDSQISSNYIPNIMSQLVFVTEMCVFCEHDLNFHILLSCILGLQVVAIKMCLCAAPRIIQNIEVNKFWRAQINIIVLWQWHIAVNMAGFLDSVQCLMPWTELILNTKIISIFSSVTGCAHSCGVHKWAGVCMLLSWRQKQPDLFSIPDDR